MLINCIAAFIVDARIYLYICITFIPFYCADGSFALPGACVRSLEYDA